MVVSETIRDAQQRLAEACMKLSLSPQSAAISAYVSVIQLTAQVNALIEYTAPYELDADGAPIMTGPYDELLLKQLTAQTEAFEQHVRKPQILTSSSALNG